MPGASLVVTDEFFLQLPRTCVRAPLLRFLSGSSAYDSDPENDELALALDDADDTGGSMAVDERDARA
jgi:hypothetical protein